MLSRVAILLSLLLAPGCSPCAEGSGADPYLGRTPPGAIPVVFARGVVSLYGRGEEKISISRSEDRIIFGTHDMSYTSFTIMEMVYVDGSWSAPATPAAFGSGNVGSCTFSPDGSRIYYRSWERGLAYVEWLGDRWSPPVVLPPNINTTLEIGFPSVAGDGTLYFVRYGPSGDGNEIFRSRYVDGVHQDPQRLPPNINDPSFTVNDPYIAPDESYLLFAANKAGGSGRGDLHVCFRLGENEWTDPINLGTRINSVNYDYAPSISPDGRYLFFTRWGQTSLPDIYWVEAAQIWRLNPLTRDRAPRRAGGRVTP